MISTHFSSQLSLALILHVFTQLSFTFPWTVKCTKKIYAVHLLAQDKLTLNDPNSR